MSTHLCKTLLYISNSLCSSYKSLQIVYDAVHNLAIRFFDENLPKEVLENTELWKVVYDRSKWLPLPATNTREAKDMRIAACVGALGSRLTRRIFVPVYVTPDRDEITNLLSTLSSNDPDREIYLRSVLLRTSPELQERIREERTAEIVSEICASLGRLLGDQRREEFRTQVDETCRIAIDQWDFMRRAETKVDTLFPDFNYQEETGLDFSHNNWIPVRLNHVGGQMDQNGSPKPKGNSKTNGTKKKDTVPITNGIQNNDGGVRFGNRDVFYLLWPGFIVGDAIVKGYVLLYEQAKPAIAELTSRRTKRHSIRSHSMSRPSSYIC